MDTNNILVMIFYLYNSSSNIPPGGLVALLVLNLDSVINLQWCQGTCPMLKTLCIPQRTLSKSPFSIFLQQQPLWLWLISGEGCRKKISKLSSKNHLGWRTTSITIKCFLYCITALWKLSVFSFPSSPTFSLRRRFMDLTASSVL